MQFSFIETFEVVMALMLLCVPGFLVIKLKLVGHDFIKGLAKIVLNIAQPFLIISVFTKYQYDRIYNQTILSSLLMSLLVYALFITLTSLLFKDKDKSSELLNGEKKSHKVHVMLSSFGNVGYLGVPILTTLLSGNPHALIALTMCLIVFNGIAFTLGSVVITGDFKRIHPKKSLLNPVMISIYIGLILFFCKIELPTIIQSPITRLGDIGITLTQILLGMRLATINFKEIFNDKKIFISSAIKLIIMPIVMYYLCVLFKIDTVVTTVILILSTLPPASLVLSFAEVYDQNTKSASSGIIFQSLLSIITIPLILMIL